MVIRPYTPQDCRQIAQLFYDTVHSVCLKDYTEEQANAWADGCIDLEQAVDTPCILVHASITARPFFENRGYRLIREQTVERHGIPLTNFVLELKR